MSLILKSLNFHKTKVENKGKYRLFFVKVGILWGGGSSAMPLVWKALSFFYDFFLLPCCFIHSMTENKAQAARTARQSLQTQNCSIRRVYELPFSPPSTARLPGLHPNRKSSGCAGVPSLREARLLSGRRSGFTSPWALASEGKKKKKKVVVGAWALRWFSLVVTEAAALLAGPLSPSGSDVSEASKSSKTQLWFFRVSTRSNYIFVKITGSTTDFNGSS